MDEAYRWAIPYAGIREQACIQLALWCAKEVAVGAGATDNADHWGEICQYLEDKLKLMNPKQSSVSDDTNNIS